MKTSLVPMSFARALEQVKKNKLHMVGPSFKSDFEGLLTNKKSLGSFELCVYTRSDSKYKYSKNINSFNSYVLGHVPGYTYTDEIDSYIKKNKSNKNKIMAASGKDVVNKLLKLMVERKSIDVFLEGAVAVDYAIKKNGYQNKVKKGKCLFSEPLVMGFSPTNPESKKLIEVLDQGILQLRKSQQLKQFLKPYSAKDWLSSK